jgi:hypothetical protein
MSDFSTSTEMNGKDNAKETDEEHPNDQSLLFPNHPSFTVPVEIRETPQYGPNQYGVFALEDIPPNTKFWLWTNRVQSIHFSEMKKHIANNFEVDNVESIRKFLRQGFVLPSPRDDHWNSNPTDAGCFMNHSSFKANCGNPHGSLRLIEAGEELVMDYGSNGNPEWYVELCHFYGILTGIEIAQNERERGGLVEPAFLV